MYRESLCLLQQPESLFVQIVNVVKEKVALRCAFDPQRHWAVVVPLIHTHTVGAARTPIARLSQHELILTVQQQQHQLTLTPVQQSLRHSCRHQHENLDFDGFQTAALRGPFIASNT